MPGIDLANFIIKDDKVSITITIPEEISTKDIYIQIRKMRIASDINRSFPDKKQIIFIDTFSFPDAPEG